MAESPKKNARSLSRFSSVHKSQEIRPPRHPGLRSQVSLMETVKAPSIRNYRTQVIMFNQKTSKKLTKLQAKTEALRKKVVMPSRICQDLRERVAD